MRYLIDTNIFLYALEDRPSLDRSVLEILEDYENNIYISSESIKEVIHLAQNRRIKSLWKSPKELFKTVEKDLGCIIKYVAKEHLATLSMLDIVPGHNDPSDRLIIAQAITEKMPLISSDRDFEPYRKQKLNFIYNKK